MKAHFLFLIILVVGVHLDGLAQGEGAEKQLELVQQQIANNDWLGAEKTLRLINTTELRRSVIDNINFSFGYLYHLQANHATDSAQEQQFMDSAFAYYMKVHEENPRNKSVNQNLSLLYQREDKPEQAIAFMKRAFRQEDRSEYAMSIADLYLQLENFDSSLYYYNKAIREQPSLEQAHQRLVYIYSIKPPLASELFSHCQIMIDSGFPELSSRAMSDFIVKKYQSDSTSCQNAFLWWVSLFGKGHAANEKFASVFPIRWNFQGFTEVELLLKDPKASTKLKWWRSNKRYAIEKNEFVPRLVITEALSTLAKHRFLEGRNAEGITTLENAYDILTDGNAERFLMHSDVPDIFYDLASSLGMAYVQYSDIVPDSQFKELERDLFEGKGQAYGEGNTESIVKFHTTLGLIYATQDNWSSGIRGGIFQLRNAINKSPEERNTSPLKELLIRGYLKNNSISDARELSLSTAMSYLNDDNLFSAARSLSLYDSLQGDKQTPKYEQLNSILSIRNKITTLTISDSVSLLKLNNEIDAITKSKNDWSSYFYKIQRFKIFSDIGTKAQESSNERVTEFYHYRALDEANDIKTLSNLRDVNRLNVQQETMQKSVKFGVAPDKLTPNDKQDGIDLKYFKVWSVQVPGNLKAQEVRMQQEVLTAAKVAEAVNATETATGEKAEVIIDKSRDVIVVPAENTNKNDLEKGIKKSLGNEKVKYQVQVIKKYDF